MRSPRYWDSKIKGWPAVSKSTSPLDLRVTLKENGLFTIVTFKSDFAGLMFELSGRGRTEVGTW